MPGFPAGVHLIGGRNIAPVQRALADAFYAPLLPIVLGLHRQGLSLRGIARELERRGIPTRREFRRWHPRQVARVLGRAHHLPAVLTASRGDGPSQVSRTVAAAPFLKGH